MAEIIRPIQFSGKHRAHPLVAQWHAERMALLAEYFGPKDNVIPMPVDREDRTPCDV
jgi:hypothetical protein